MANFLIVHGGWGGGWAWRKMRPLMAARRHEFFTPTLTGQGERAHLAHPDVDLDTHIQDIVAVIEYEDLSDVILVGHSYGGMVATGAADRLRERVKRLIYVDAFVPEAGKSVNDYFFAGERRGALLQSLIDGWKVPAQPLPKDTPADEAAWMEPRRAPQPFKSIEQKFAFKNGPLTLPRAYIYCQRCSPGDPFRQFLARAQKEGWSTREIDASHSPHVTAPGALMDILETFAQ
jgi:pimeloyl-ACP methyl ester carboxylesterase